MKRAAVWVVGVGLTLASASAMAISWQSVLTMLRNMQNENSSWAVTTKQTALAANQESQAELNSKKQLANAMGAITMSDRLMRAVTSFDAALGQPSTIKCIAQRDGKLHVESESQAEKDKGRLMATFASTRVGTRAAADAETLGVHRQTFCTVSEAKSGLCELTANGMQGWDANYAGAFGEFTLSAEGELGGYAYAAMVADKRAEAATDCMTLACSAEQSNQLAIAAASAMSMSSLVGQVTDRRSPMLTGE